MPQRRQQPATNPEPSESPDDPFAPQRRMARQVRRLAAVIWPLEDEELAQAPGAIPITSPEDALAYQLPPAAQLRIYAPLVAALEAPYPAVAHAILHDLQQIGRADTDEVIIHRVEQQAPEVYAIPLDISHGEVVDLLRVYLRLRPLGPNDLVVCANCRTSWRYEVVRSWDGQTIEAFVRGDQCPSCPEQQNLASGSLSKTTQANPPKSPGAPGDTPAER